MAGFIYPHALLESWFRLSKRPPRLEARGEFDEVDDGYQSSGESYNGDAMDSMGNYGQIVDYSDEDTTGYSEAGVDDRLDSIMSRPDMHIELVDDVTRPRTRSIDAPSSGVKEKEKRAYGTSPEARAKQLAREQFDHEVHVRDSEAKRVRDEVVAAYEAYPEALENDDVKQRLEELKTDFECDEFSKLGIQDIWKNMERLGIAAHDAGCVPPGLPENPMTLDTLTSLAYLSIGRNGYMYILQHPEKLVNMFERDTLVKVVREVNSHIMGTAGGKPRLTGDLYRGFALDSSGSKARSNQVKVSIPAHNASATKNTIGQAEMKLAGYTYPGVKTGQVYAAPYDLVKNVLSCMSDDSMDNRNSAAIARLKSHGLTADKLTADLIFMGSSNFKKKYNAAPTLKKIGDKYISRSCYITVPKSPETGITMSKSCAELLRTELRRILDGRNIKLIKAGTVADKSVLRDACADLDRMLADTKSTMYTFDSASIAELLHGDYTAQQGKKNSFVDGQLKVVTPPPEPLFGFIQSEMGPAISSDEMQTTDYGEGEGVSYSNEMRISAGRDTMSEEADTGNVRFDTMTATADTYLTANEDISPFYRKLGFSKEDIPTKDDEHADKSKFFSSVLEKVSDCFHEFGVESGVNAEGLNLHVDITPEDRELLGDSILTIWKYYAKQYADEIEASNSPIKYGLKRQFLWKMLDTILRWFDTFNTGISSIDEMKRKLKSGDYDSTDLMKLLPSVNMGALVKETIINGAVSKGISSDAGNCTPAEVFAFVKKFLVNMVKNHNADVTTAPVIEQVFTSLKEKYETREAIIEASSSERADTYAEADFYEWCVLRFMASAIPEIGNDDESAKGRLIPPEQVGAAEEAAETDGNESPMRKRLRRYEEVLSSKPPYLNAHAWIRKVGGGLTPEEYDYLTKSMAGDFRVMDETPAEVSIWLQSDYIKYGNRSEVLLLLLSLLYVCIEDREANDDILDNGDDMMSGLPDIFGKWQPLNELWSEYGMDLVNTIVGYDVGDDGVAMDELLCLFSGIPKHMGQVSDDYDSKMGYYDAVGADIPKDSGIIDRLDSIYDTLRGTGFLRFNGIA